MSPHAFAPEQVISHFELPWHVMSPQPPAGQTTVQEKPLGHVKSLPPVPSTMQV